VTTVTDPLGHQTIRHYDPDGNLDTYTDGDGHVTTYKYDLANELRLIIRPDGTTQATDYNPDGTMLDQVDGLQNKTTYAYDPLGHLKSMTTSATTACAGGCTTTYVFDALGKLATLVDPQQRTTTYGYDADNELISINYSDGHTPNVSNIKYDGNGHRKSMTDGTGTSTWTYDSLNRLTSSQDGAGYQVTYGYDLKSQLTSITYPGQSSGVIRTYDDAGRLSTVKDWLKNTTGFGYDADSNLTAETFPTGTNNVDTFTPDAGGRLMSISDAQGSSSVATFSYGRDAANQVTSETYSFTGGSSTSVNYGYTGLDQVCYSAPSPGGTCSAPPSGASPYGYDPSDNLTTLGATAPDVRCGQRAVFRGDRGRGDTWAAR
jgi:YD repeat-containing protein